MAASLDDLSPAQLKTLQTAEKLFRLAGKNPNKHEAEQAMAKGMKLLEDLNLDMSVIEQGGTERVKRSDEKMAGGLYRWQRDIWEALAKLHFCYYWSQYNYDPDKVNKYQTRKAGTKVMGGFRFEHRLVGRTVNVVATRNMAQYLEQVVERLVRDHLHHDATQFWTNYATSFRQGVAEEITNKIYQRRQDMLREEQIKAHEAAERAAASGMADASTSRALTLSSVVKQEQEANHDFLYGEGDWARREARIAVAAKRQAEAEAEYTKWAADHPEEAQKMEAEQRKNARRTPWNYGMGGGRADNRDYSAYKAGREAGKSVSLDQQAGQSRTAGRIG